MNLIDKPKSGISPACIKLLHEAMDVDLNGISLIKRNWMFHNIINRAYMLGVEKAKVEFSNLFIDGKFNEILTMDYTKKNEQHKEK